MFTQVMEHHYSRICTAVSWVVFFGYDNYGYSTYGNSYGINSMYDANSMGSMYDEQTSMLGGRVVVVNKH
jgi:hypothetical protein